MSRACIHGFVEVAGGDDLPFDDRRWLAFEARLPDRVLLIDGEPGPSVFGNETYYLETALRLRLPGEESKASPTPYEPVRHGLGRPRRVTLPDLNPFRVVALCNVADISPADASALARFVASGGSLIIFTGDQVKAGAYAGTRARPGSCPRGWRSRPRSAPTGSPTGSKDHPIFGPFADPQYGDLRTLRFRQITRLVPDSGGPRARDSAGGRRRWWSRKRLGQGRCLLFAFPADNAWGDWAIHRLYLPLVHQLLGYLTDRLPETSPVRSEHAGQGPGQAPGVVVENGRAWSATSTPPNPRSSGPRWPSCARSTGCPKRSQNRPAREQRSRDLGRRRRTARTSCGERSPGPC